MNLVNLTAKIANVEINSENIITSIHDLGSISISLLKMSTAEIAAYNSAYAQDQIIYNGSITQLGYEYIEGNAGFIPYLRGFIVNEPNQTVHNNNAFSVNQYFAEAFQDLNDFAPNFTYGVYSPHTYFMIYFNDDSENYGFVYYNYTGKVEDVNTEPFQAKGIYNLGNNYKVASTSFKFFSFNNMRLQSYQSTPYSIYIPIIVTDAQQTGYLYLTSATRTNTHGVNVGRITTSDMSYEVYRFLSDLSPSPTPGSKDISDATIILSPQSFLYDGQFKEPTITVTMDDTVLTRGVDYLATYENNLSPGTAHVLVAGIGDYTGSKRVDFTIYENEPVAGKQLYATIPKYSYDYTGEAITPYVTVWAIDGLVRYQITEGTDYVKTYQNNINPGQASILIAGINDYSDSGSIIVYFNIVKTAPDPYSPIGPSGPSDSQGSFDPVSDDLPQYTIPTFNLSDTGFTRIFNPTLTQIRDLANYMWTDQTFFETLFNKLIQVFENPMDAIIAFNIVPCEIPDGGTTEFKVLYIPTGIQMTYAAQQYVSVDCGSVTIQRMFGSAIDFNPYTKIKAYLPYIGMIDLDTDECMGKTLRLVYTIDIVSGSCVAQIYVDGDPLYQFSGHCAQYIPLAASDFSNYASAIIGIAKLAVGAATAGGAGATAAVGSNGLQLTGKTIETSTERNSTTGRQVTVGTVTRDEYSLPPTQASFASQAPGLVANTLAQVISSKIGIQHTSGFTGASGYLAYRQPFVNIEYPSIANPANYGAFNGRPCMMSLALNQLTGYTVIQQIQLTGFTCTQPELEELNTLLKGGVVF